MTLKEEINNLWGAVLLATLLGFVCLMMIMFGICPDQDPLKGYQMERTCVTADKVTKSELKDTESEHLKVMIPEAADCNSICGNSNVCKRYFKDYSDCKTFAAYGKGYDWCMDYCRWESGEPINMIRITTITNCTKVEVKFYQDVNYEIDRTEKGIDLSDTTSQRLREATHDTEARWSVWA